MRPRAAKATHARGGASAGGIGWRLSKGIVQDKNRVVVGLFVGIIFLFIEMILTLARAYSVEEAVARKKRSKAGQFNLNYEYGQAASGSYGKEN